MSSSLPGSTGLGDRTDTRSKVTAGGLGEGVGSGGALLSGGLSGGLLRGSVAGSIAQSTVPSTAAGGSGQQAPVLFATESGRR